MPDDKTIQRKVEDAFKRAAEQGAFKMKVRHDLGGELIFEQFATDVVGGAAMDLIIQEGQRLLEAQGIRLNFDFGGGSSWEKYKPDRYTIMVDGKTIRAGVQWDF